jgi:hypothetical protein
MMGKCEACHQVFTWNGPLALRDARCPVHKTPLTRTTYLSQWPRSTDVVDMPETEYSRVCKALNLMNAKEE